MEKARVGDGPSGATLATASEWVTFGAAIKLARQERGLSLNELAALCECSGSAIFGLEAGRGMSRVAQRVASELAIENPVPTRSPIRRRAADPTPLARLRLDLHVKQDELAELLGVSVPRYSCIERGSQLPTVEQIERLAMFFDVDAATVFPDLVIALCPCDDEACQEHTVNGQLAHGHANKTPAGRERARNQRRREWLTGEGFALWRYVSCSGPTRQKWARRWVGRAVGGTGGRPPGFTPEQAAQVRRLRSEHPSWGRGSLARAAGISEQSVRTILNQPG